MTVPDLERAGAITADRQERDRRRFEFRSLGEGQLLPVTLPRR
jgi:hypothetical protein